MIFHFLFRYTEWVPTSPVEEGGIPKWNLLKATELYDHKNDPDETVNLIFDKNEHYLKVGNLLSQVLRDKVNNTKNTWAMNEVMSLSKIR